MLYLGCFPVLAQATITGPIACLETPGNGTSQAAVYTLVDANGNRLPIHAFFNNFPITEESGFVFGDTMYWGYYSFSKSALANAVLTGK